MKKLRILVFIVSVVTFLECKKETATTSALPEEIAAAKPSAPSPTILQWQKTYGSSLNELGYTIAKANDGTGLVFVGSALGNGGDITGHHGGVGGRRLGSQNRWPW